MKSTKGSIAVRNIVRVGAMAAIIMLLSQISFPLPSGVPVTLQTLAVSFAGFILGPLYGTISVLVYILLGIVGVPVFSGFSGGLGVVIGITGGYIIGFIPFSAFCGLGVKSARKKLYPLTVLFPLAGLLICHLCGLFQFCAVKGMFDLSSFVSAFLLCSAPYLVKDVISVAVAFFIAELLHKRVPAVFPI